MKGFHARDGATMSEAPPSPATEIAPRKTWGGLTMLAFVGFWFVLLAGWMGWHLYSQVKEIRGFTDPAPQLLGLVPPTGDEKAALRGRLTAFAAAIDAKQKATLELTAADLNHLLAAQEPVSRLQDIARVEEITDVIRVKVALAINGIPFSGERLYLNGFIGVRPEIRKDTGLMFLTRTIEVPGRALTPGFTQTYLEANHLDGLAMDEVRKDEELHKVLGQITAVRCESGRVIAEYVP